MDVRLIPRDEVKVRIASKDKVILKKVNREVKELIEKVRKRRKYHSKYNSEHQKKKALCRNNNLDPKGKMGKGYITEVLVAKKLGIKTCFDVTGNFNYPGYDILEHKDYGKINAKGSTLSKSGHHHFNTNKSTKPDFFFCIGYDEEMKHVISVYIILNDDDVNILSSISIPYYNSSIWDTFKEIEEEVKKWDELYHTMKLENCPVLKKVKKI